MLCDFMCFVWCTFECVCLSVCDVLWVCIVCLWCVFGAWVFMVFVWFECQFCVFLYVKSLFATVVVVLLWVCVCVSGCLVWVVCLCVPNVCGFDVVCACLVFDICVFVFVCEFVYCVCVCVCGCVSLV